MCNLSLSALSGVLLGFSFPPSRVGILACFGLVPVLFLLDRVEGYGKGFRYSYFTFLVFNAVSIGWIGGWTVATDFFLMIGSSLLVLVHPFFFCVPIFAYQFLKRRFGQTAAVFSFPFLWVTFEYLHSLGELAFPWLTLGNTATYDIFRIQYITYTGVYGISFWIVWMNVLMYYFLPKLARRQWNIFSLKSLLALVLILFTYYFPHFLSSQLIPVSNGQHSKLRIALVQPHIDPWKKWELSGHDQVHLCLDLSKQAASEGKLDLIIWPETAITYYVLLPRYRADFAEVRGTVDSLRIPLITGFPDVTYYLSRKEAPLGSKPLAGTEQFYDSFNSILMVEPQNEMLQRYHKIKLVPFSERVPYAQSLTFLVDLVKWKVGLTGWGIGRDSTIFERHNPQDPFEPPAKFWSMVCYESIYPGFVSDFVRKGAQFLVVVTNDSWWGKSAGPYQHAQYAVLRAIENRRSIARCANGGISCFVDPYGRIESATELYTRATLKGEVELSNDLTFYARYGDMFSVVCSYLSFTILGAGIFSLIMKRFRR